MRMSKQLLTKEEVVEELCKLCTEVNEYVYDFSVGTDCFCSNKGYDPDNFRFDRKVLDYIQWHVREAMTNKHIKGLTTNEEESK